MDSGIWLVRESPQGNTAMPIFGLEAKTAETAAHPLTAALFATQVDGEPIMYLMLSAVCPGLLDEMGVSPA